MTTEIYNLLKPGTYVTGAGEEKTTYTQVGVAFKHKSGEGFTVKIPEGVLLTGEMVLLPRSAGEDKNSQG